MIIATSPYAISDISCFSCKNVVFWGFLFGFFFFCKSDVHESNIRKAEETCNNNYSIYYWMAFIFGIAQKRVPIGIALKLAT